MKNVLVYFAIMLPLALAPYAFLNETTNIYLAFLFVAMKACIFAYILDNEKAHHFRGFSKLLLACLFDLAVCSMAYLLLNFKIENGFIGLLITLLSLFLGLFVSTMVCYSVSKPHR